MDDAARMASATGLALLALAAAGPVAGAPAVLPPAALARAADAAADAARAQAPAGARVLALPGAPDPRLRLAACAEIQARPAPGAPAWGRTRVQLRCARGPVAWAVTVPVTVQVWAPAWVAASAHASGETLAAARLRTAVVDWAAGTTPPLPPTADPTGRTLARPLAEGEPLREADLRARQWFVAGDTVRVTARGPGFAVAAEAQALAPGFEGRPVRLKATSGRVFTALPVAERQAEVLL